MVPRTFQKIVYDHYQKHGRHTLPWRKTKDPYRILVSEVMLQQTQVDRVISYYKDFLKRFPTARALAGASLGEVLRLWQGLGYNRRAKMLWQAAQSVTTRYAGRFPKTYTELTELPGVGPYTAGAVMAFAYNEPVVMIETNIRTVYLHHFFAERHDVHDKELMPLIEQTLDHTDPRTWYTALMDYGTHLKRTIDNPSRKSVHHVTQAKFKGSDREIRGAILRALSEGALKEASLITTLSFDRQRITTQLLALLHEGMVVRKRGAYTLP